jgi:hypothetical protein
MHPIGRFFNSGSTESQVGLRSGALRDLWVVISPNIAPLNAQIDKGDVVLGRAIVAAQRLPAAQQARQLNTIYALRDLAIREIARRFVTHPWSSTFLLEVSPLVMWLWIGAIIAASGGLIALWPVPRGARARVHGAARPPVPAGAPAPAAAPLQHEHELV